MLRRSTLDKWRANPALAPDKSLFVPGLKLGFGLFLGLWALDATRRFLFPAPVHDHHHPPAGHGNHGDAAHPEHSPTKSHH